MINWRYEAKSKIDTEKLAEMAAFFESLSEDSYSDYGVGAALLVEKDDDSTKSGKAYAGFNINLSGMEYKVHAEQLALFQAIIDWKYHISGGLDNMRLDKIVVTTSENDMALKCGHCLQSYSTLADGDMEWIAVSTPKHKSEWEYEKYTYSELWGESYTDRR